MTYKIQVTNSGGPVTQNLTLSDVFTGGLMINSVMIGNTPYAPSVSNNSFDIVIPSSSFANSNIVTVLITATVPATAPANFLYDNYVFGSYNGSFVMEPSGLVDNNAWIGTP